MKLKIGFGYDVHRLEKNYPLYIGGIKIPHTQGAVGHSDADVLLHAICDALLGAASLRDIGFQFPDTSPDYKGIDSKILLQKTVDFIKEKGYNINNIDATICLEKPKVSKYIDEMIDVISNILNVETDDVSIKATTTEKLGFVGNEQGISAYAVALLIKN